MLYLVFADVSPLQNERQARRQKEEDDEWGNPPALRDSNTVHAGWLLVGLGESRAEHHSYRT